MAVIHQFEAFIEGGVGGSWVTLPDEITAALGGKGRVPVVASFDGVDYTGSAAPYDGAHRLGILKAIQQRIGKAAGDRVEVTVRRDDSERTVTIPDDVAAALSERGLEAAFNAWSYTRRRQAVASIEDAKRLKTRAARIAKLIDELA